MSEVKFERENRYIVIKRSDLKKVPVTYRSSLITPMFNLIPHLPKREYVVVESDWPEYHFVWLMLEHRMGGYPVPDFNDVKCAADVQVMNIELDAQRLRADTAEADRGEWKRAAEMHEHDSLQSQQELAAAEQCIATMRHALEVAEERLLVAEQHLDLGEDDSVNFEHSILTVRAALNPKPEAGSHE